MFGPHGPFILGSYGALLVAVIVELWSLSRRRKAAHAQARQTQERARKLGRSTRFEEHA